VKPVAVSRFACRPYGCVPVTAVRWYHHREHEPHDRRADRERDGPGRV